MTAFPRGLTALLLAPLLAVVLLASPAQADELSEQLTTLLRRARVAAEVEGRADEAARLYEQVIKIAPDRPEGMEAALALIESGAWTAERLGRRPFLDRLAQLSERFGDAMDTEQKQQVHAHVVRHLRVGEQLRTPFGIVIVAAGRASVTSTSSPLAERLLQMIERHKLDRWFRSGTSLPDRGAYLDLQKDIEGLGAEAATSLEQLLESGRPTQAYGAGVLLSYLDVGRALEGVAKAIRRSRAPLRVDLAGSLMRLVPSDVVSYERTLEAMRPILDDPSLSDVHATAAVLIARSATLDQIAQLARRDTSRSALWVQHAVDKVEGDASQADALASLWTDGHGDERSLLKYLGALGRRVRQPGGRLRAPLDDLTQPAARKLVDAVLEQPWAPTPPPSHGKVRPILAKAQPDAATRAAWVRKIWERILAVPPERVPEWLVLATTSDPMLDPSRPWGLAPVDLLATEAAREAFLARLPQLALDPALLKPLFDDESGAAYELVVRHLEAASPAGRVALRAFVRRLPIPPDRAREIIGAGCLRLMGEAPFNSPDVTPAWMYVAAAKTGDPAFLERLLASLRGSPHWEQWTSGPALGVRAYEGEGWLAFVQGALADRKLPAHLAETFLSSLREERRPGCREHFAAVLRDVTHPHQTIALKLLRSSTPDDATQLARWFEEARVGEAPWTQTRRAPWVRKVLTQIALRDRNAHAVPFLLAEYARPDGDATFAAEAMDAIREHAERLRYFTDWARSAGKSPASELLPLLDDPDSEIRAATVRALGALGALGERSVLPRLIQIAREDADVSLRRLALEAIERIANGAAPPTPASPPAPGDPDTAVSAPKGG